MGRRTQKRKRVLKIIKIIRIWKIIIIVKFKGRYAKKINWKIKTMGIKIKIRYAIINIKMIFFNKIYSILF